MTIRPESGPEYGQELWEKPAPAPEQLEEEERELYGGERELYEHETEDRDRDRDDFDLESNELHAAGQVCQRCGAVISAMQEVRRLPDGQWVHEVCPVHPS